MKQIFLTICIAITANLLYAQRGFGIKAGANFSKLKFSSNNYTTKNIVGVHAGLFYKIGIGKKAGIQPEINFSTEGNKWATNTTTGRVYESQVRVPIVFQYTVFSGIYVEAGPQYSLLVSIKQSKNGGEKEDIREYYKLGSFGYAVGAGFRFPGGLSGLRAGLRLNGDFSKINSEPVGGGELKNSVVQLSVMYSFSKK